MRIFGALLGVALCVGPVAAAPADRPEHGRIYLLGSENDFLYWSVDPHDPELSAARVERRCSAANQRGTGQWDPCNLTFNQASRIEEPVAWNAASPLRFHFELEVRTPAPYTVHLSNPSGSFRSAPATEVAPGVWEGSVTSAGQLSVTTWSQLEVEVVTDSTELTMSLRTGGASWIDLPNPVRSAGVPMLLEQSPRPQGMPSTLRTDQRSFTFNDDEWSSRSFTGDLQQTRTFDLVVDRDARFVLAWVELFRTPIAHDLVRGRDADSRKLTDSARAELLRNGQRVARGTNPGLYGLGNETVLAMDVPAGPLTLSIAPNYVWPTNFQQGSPYRAHALVVYGDRTVASMRWVSMFADYPGYGPMNSPMVQICPGFGTEVLPVTSEVTTFNVDMDVDTINPLSKWTLAYLLPPNSWHICGSSGTGDRMRFTFPYTGIQRVGPMVASEQVYSEWRSTVFDWEVRYSYTPRPEEAPPV